MSTTLIGRENEKKLLKRLFESNKAEFLAIYGRRRVGKTYLVTQYFKDKGVFFEITGSFTAEKEEQLIKFHRLYCALFEREDSLDPPKNWDEAFHRLTNAVKKIGPLQKVILFFDELPWLAGKNSGFVSAMDYYWNRFFSRMPNVLLIVSGSAASWMIKHILNDTGGLYQRLSAHLRLLPFSLSEVEQFLNAQNIELTRKQICEVYMATGGIPKYLTFLERGLSSTQLINNLCFKPQSPLLTEFHNLYHSLFRNAEQHINVIKALAKKRRGMNRQELFEEAGLTYSGHSVIILRELEESGFIMTLLPFGKKARDAIYFLNDEYSLFYLSWIEPVKESILRGVENNHWLKVHADQSWKSWAGFAFESICLKHVNKIKEALGIAGVTTDASYWKTVEKGKIIAEIDLVIDRADHCINLCEMKFHSSEYTMTKQDALALEQKKDIFKEKTATKKALFTTLITSFGAKENGPYINAVDNQITIEDLF